MNKELIFKHIFIFTLVFATFIAEADEWTGPDKTQHAQAGAVIGAAITLATKDPTTGCVASMALGAAKEIYDHNRPQHESSMKDFAVTAIAGCLVAQGTGFIVAPGKILFKFTF